MFDKKEN